MVIYRRNKQHISSEQLKPLILLKYGAMRLFVSPKAANMMEVCFKEGYKGDECIDVISRLKYESFHTKQARLPKILRINL